MKLLRALGYIWRRADRFDRGQIVFYGGAWVFVIIGFFVHYPLWCYVLLYGGIVVNVALSYWELRKAQRRVDESLRNLRRHQEVEYLEWLHDASPDD